MNRERRTGQRAGAKAGVGANLGSAISCLLPLELSDPPQMGVSEVVTEFQSVAEDAVHAGAAIKDDA